MEKRENCQNCQHSGHHNCQCHGDYVCHQHRHHHEHQHQYCRQNSPWSVGTGPGRKMDSRELDTSDYGGERIGGSNNPEFDEYNENRKKNQKQ